MSGRNEGSTMLPAEFAKKMCDSIELLNNQCAGMHTALEGIQKSQEKLFNIVANGNGQPSLISQASTLKARTDAMEDDIKVVERKVALIESREAACSAKVQEQLKRRGNPVPAEESRIKRYGLWAAIGSGVAAFFLKIVEWASTGGGQ